MYICVYVNICIYIYIYRERERERFYLPIYLSRVGVSPVALYLGLGARGSPVALRPQPVAAAAAS